MDKAKFIEKFFEVYLKLLKFRTEQDKSEKRILRDKIRAIVKELTRV